MKGIFTLKERMPEQFDRINGEIFFVQKLNDEEIMLIDPLSSETIWNIGRIVNIIDDPYGITITTVTGLKYSFVEIHSIIPSANLVAIYVNKEHKPINYGDGYTKITFQFNHPITREEFLEFLKKNNYKIREKDDKKWYLDYSVIEGSEDKWIYTWIKVYTD